MHAETLESLHWHSSSGFPQHIWAVFCRDDFQWKKQILVSLLSVFGLDISALHQFM